MLEIHIPEQIELLKKTVKEKIDARQIFLFGSHAYGKSGEESDLDVCIVTDLENKRKIDVIREVRRELIDQIALPLDILVYSEKEFYERAALANTLEHKILVEGIKLHG